MSNDRPDDPTLDVGPPTRALCQIGNCIQFTVACIGGANVCNEHRDWKLRKARPTVEPAPVHHPFVGGYAIDPKRPAHCQTCGGHISEHTHGYRLDAIGRTLDLLAGRTGTPVPAEQPTAAQPPGLDPGTHAHIVEALGTCMMRVEARLRTDSRSFDPDVAGLLVAARAARVALGMPLPPAPPATLYQLAGFLSADIPELHGVEVPRIAESVERFIKTLI